MAKNLFLEGRLTARLCPDRFGDSPNICQFASILIISLSETLEVTGIYSLFY